MTYSSGRSRRASKTRAYRSSTRPALASNSGSRRKIHDRVCHGLIASSRSQRQIVVADASVTPRSMTSRCSSVREKRPSGSPCEAGNSHAIALTSATCCGGKTARATRARLVLKPNQPIVEEAPSPLPHDPGGRIQPRGDLGIGNTRGGVQHDPRPLNLLPRPLLRPRHPRQLAALTLAELDLVTGRARHRSITSPCPPQLLHRFRLELADGSTSRRERASPTRGWRARDDGPRSAPRRDRRGPHRGAPMGGRELLELLDHHGPIAAVRGAGAGRAVLLDRHG